MTFGEWLNSTKLPNTAQIHLPQALSKQSMNELMQRDDGEQILLDAINEINNGSVETIEKLVEQRLGKQGKYDGQ